jgi:hypothetical protein
MARVFMQPLQWERYGSDQGSEGLVIRDEERISIKAVEDSELVLIVTAA